MISTFLPDNLPEHQAINDIYANLASKVLNKVKHNPLSVSYNGASISFDTVSSIKKFLTAKDFYAYDFNLDGSSAEHGFFSDLLSLPGTMKLKTIIENKQPSGKFAKQFLARYPRADFEDQYKNLEDYYNGHHSETKLDITYLKSHPEHLFTTESDISNYENYKHCEKVFSYTLLTQKTDYRHIILNEMDVPVCPYCNMNYTVSYNNGNIQKNTADLDHFYPKSIYPQYSLCLYNFVPSCPVCNSRLKLNKTMTRETHIFPHEESFKDNAVFTISNIPEIIMDQNTDVKLELNNKSENEKIDASNSVFCLNERYKAFHLYAKELLEKAQIYNETYLDELQPFVENAIDIKQLIFGKNASEEVYARETLGKLRMDLLKQLGIY